MKDTRITIDGNEAAARIAYKASEVIAIYPITPSSTMGEWADEWASLDKKNLWGTVPLVQEMQSEGGAAGAVHGALQAGALSTTFTASQGLLLMIPNMYKIAGELTPVVFHVAARSLAAHALSIFGDHADIMSARSTGWAMLAASGVQEAGDMALIAHSATLKSRIPFVHFFDGFRTSHEVAKVQTIQDDVIRAMIDETLVDAHRARSLSPDHPVLRGTAQNPDAYFQAREACNSFYNACPTHVEEAMRMFERLTGRAYNLFDYYGAPDAERIIIVMGSGANTIEETVDALAASGEKVGLINVRLFRPFSASHFLKAIPASAKSIAVLDRSKEPGALGEPLYQDILTALFEAETQHANLKKVIGGRYGLSSKEFTPGMVKAVFDELKKEKPRNHFTIGIHDDVTHTSLDWDLKFTTEPNNQVRAMFYGLGADGTVSANKSSIKIIGEETENYAQGYFVYDSKKSGAITVSHLRFGPDPIRSSYLVQTAHFVACHQWPFLEQYDILASILPGGTFLLNSPFLADEVWDKLPERVQSRILERKVKLFVIDAMKVAKETGMGGRINTIMQTCFFAISGVLERSEAIGLIKAGIKKTYGKKGEQIVEQNFAAVDKTLDFLFEVDVSQAKINGSKTPLTVSAKAPAFVRDVIAPMMEGRGDLLPVSAFPVDGTFQTGTAKWEKRNIASEIPIWDPVSCTQCMKCALVCPHSSIRGKIVDKEVLQGVPEGFRFIDAKTKEFKGKQFILQVAPEDCTGCGICVDICPGRNKSETRLRAINMEEQAPHRQTEKQYWEFFENLPILDRTTTAATNVRTSQMYEPYFEFSGACSGCGETPYIKLVTQLFGDRMVVANATGCSSIYGGNLPTTPWTKDANGRGPAWSNSLFEDNAEFGLGMRLSVDKQSEMAVETLKQLESQVGTQLVSSLLDAVQTDEMGIAEQRQRVDILKEKLKTLNSKEATRLLTLADYLVKKSVWIFGGDGWAYDIGFGGLDHVLSTGKNVNILVLDTEVYSNTGGQASKATPKAAVAKFAMGGKVVGKKDLARIAMSYGNVYVAQVAMGARDEQTIKAFLEAEKHQGPSIILAYSHCIAHGIDMRTAMREHRDMVASGHWMMFRYNPALRLEGKNPLQLDSAKPTKPLAEFYDKQNRFKMLTKSQPEVAQRLLLEAEREAHERWQEYERLAAPWTVAEEGGAA